MNQQSFGVFCCRHLVEVAAVMYACYGCFIIDSFAHQISMMISLQCSAHAIRSTSVQTCFAEAELDHHHHRYDEHGGDKADVQL